MGQIWPNLDAEFDILGLQKHVIQITCNSDIDYNSAQTKDITFHPQWVRSGPSGINPGIFQIRFQNIFVREPILKNLIGFVPFGANLTNFGPKLDIPDSKKKKPRSRGQHQVDHESMCNKFTLWHCGCVKSGLLLDFLATWYVWENESTACITHYLTYTGNLLLVHWACSF